MRKGWSETTVGEIAELVSRGRAPSYCEDDGIAVINQKCIRNGRIYFEFARLTDSKKKSIPDWAFLRVGDTLINSTGVGTLGRASFVSRLDVATTFDSHVTLVRPSPNLCYPPFIGLFLNFREREIEMFGGGSTGQTELSREAVNAFPVTVPPLVEQKRIVDVVSSVDIYIDALQQQSDSARVARNAVLHELLSAGGDDWTETNLGEIAKWGSGGTPKSDVPSYYDGEIPWCVIGDLTEGEVIITEKRISQEGLRNSSAKMVEPGAVMIAMYGASIGRTGLVGVPMATNQAIAFAYVDEAKVVNYFLLLYLQIQKQKFIKAGQGAAQPNISQTVLKDWPILLPSLTEQKRIAEIVSSMDELIQSTEQAVFEAKTLRSSLLSDLLSGNHEIPASYDSLLGAA